MKLLKLKTPRGMLNGNGAKIVARYITDDESVLIQHLKHPTLNWEIGWDVLDAKTGKHIATHTSTNIHKLCACYGYEEAF